MEVKIRQALEKDIDRIMNLLHQVNDVHADGRPDLFLHGRTKYDVDDLRKIISNPTTPVFVGIDSADRLAGYCFCIIEDHSESRNLAPVKTLYIDDLCVDKDCRGKHVGRTLYNAVKNYAEENGFYNITLNVWCCNPGAMKFYESLGMKPMKIAMETITARDEA
ncbi:MAG: GNAT family N-acetyltransferase [Muribaculaceae bacterium]|nr:GNAT family N-acetyltransferase [Muribaculaceae bacterium]